MADSKAGAEKSSRWGLNFIWHLIGPESKEVLKKQKDGGVKETQEPTQKSSQCPKLEQFEQHKK